MTGHFYLHFAPRGKHISIFFLIFNSWKVFFEFAENILAFRFILSTVLFLIPCKYVASIWFLFGWSSVASNASDVAIVCCSPAISNAKSRLCSESQKFWRGQGTIEYAKRGTGIGCEATNVWPVQAGEKIFFIHHSSSYGGLTDWLAW